ncbi:MAG: tetratricopeptide repeat protein [Pseudomonadota bacterium]
MDTEEKERTIANLMQQAMQYQQQGRRMDAAASLEGILTLDEKNYPALAGLSQIALGAERYDVAGMYANRAHAANSNGFEALAVLAQCHQSTGDFASALECTRRLAKLQPDNDKIQFNIGVLSEQSADRDGAASAYAQSLRLNPANNEARANLAMLYVAEGKDQQALDACAELVAHKRGPKGAPGPEAPPLPGHEAATSLFKLHMEAEQLQYLQTAGKLAESLHELPDAYRLAISDITSANPPVDANEPFSVIHPKFKDKAHWQQLLKHHNRPLHIPDVDVPGGALINPELDVEAIERSYRDSDPNYVVIDNLLTPDALQALLEFCRESTMWFDLRKNYLGAYFTEGFANALTLGIARAIPEALPGIFTDHALTQAWAYKYGAALTGIGMHADAAAVNSNFWIAPDSANNNAETGGLLLYRKAAPMAWGFDKFNNDESAMRDFLGDSVNDPIRIPHKQNRIVIFNSNLFHRTDDIHFGDRFEDRRYNMTLLYGRRGR